MPPPRRITRFFRDPRLSLSIHVSAKKRENMKNTQLYILTWILPDLGRSRIGWANRFWIDLRSRLKGLGWSRPQSGVDARSTFTGSTMVGLGSRLLLLFAVKGFPVGSCLFAPPFASGVGGSLLRCAFKYAHGEDAGSPKCICVRAAGAINFVLCRLHKNKKCFFCFTL